MLDCRALKEIKYAVHGTLLSYYTSLKMMMMMKKKKEEEEKVEEDSIRPTGGKLVVQRPTII
jgi:hypothetical protein